MMPAVAQTLAENLAEGSSLIDTEQIDFTPSHEWQGLGSRLNLYGYDIWENQQMQHALQQTKNPTNGDRSPIWYDVFFMLTRWEYAALGKQHLRSEAWIQLLPHQLLPEGLVVPALQGYGMLPLKVAGSGLMDTAALWKALGVLLHLAWYVAGTVRLNRHKESLIVQEVLLTSIS